MKKKRPALPWSISDTDEKQRLAREVVEKRIEDRGGRVVATEVEERDDPGYRGPVPHVIVDVEANEELDYTRPATEQEAVDLLILRAAEDAERLRSERLHKVRRILSKLDQDDKLLDSIYESVCHDDHGAPPGTDRLVRKIDEWRREGFKPDKLADLFVAALPNYTTLYNLTDHPHWSKDQADAVVRVSDAFRHRLQRTNHASRLFVRSGLEALGCSKARAKTATPTRAKTATPKR